MGGASALKWTVIVAVVAIAAGAAKHQSVQWQSAERPAASAAVLAGLQGGDGGDADLSGQVSIVTGSSSGIGEVVARELAALGSRVVLVVDVWPLDLASLDSVRAFAKRASTEFADSGVQRLVNNAGLIDFGRGASQAVATADGFEQHFQVNYLAPYALTRLLTPLLMAGAPSRVVMVSSDKHAEGRVDLTDLQAMHSEEPYSAWTLYANTKLMVASFAAEYGRRLEQAGAPDVVSVAANPGFSATSFAAAAPTWQKVLLSPMWLIAKPPEEGAVPVVAAAARPSARSGEYFDASAVASTPSEAATDPEIARQLWDATAVLVGMDPDVRS